MSLDMYFMLFFLFFFFKQKTAYEMRISDWSSDVCSSDLRRDQIVDPLIVIEAADIADHDVTSGKAERFGERIVARRRVAEQVEVDAVGRHDDLVRVDTARDQVTAQPFADHRPGLGRFDAMGFEPLDRNHAVEGNRG